MNKIKYCFFSAVSLFGISAYALSEVKFVNHLRPKLLEVIAAYPPFHTMAPSVKPQVVVPNQRTYAGFGGLFADHPFTLEMQKSTDASKKSYFNFIANKQKNLPRPVCGSSPETNTMVCYDLNNAAQYMATFPMFGALSLTPVFYDNSWLIGTTKGFLLKVEANPKNSLLPNLVKDNAYLWGNHSRSEMSKFRPKTIYKDGNNSTSDVSSLSPKKTNGVQWIFSSSFDFMGTPVVKNGFAYAISSSEYLHAFDWNTGSLKWSLRLAPDSSLRLTGSALTVTPTEVLVGTEMGTLLAIEPRSGAIMWSYQVKSASAEQRLLTRLPAGPDRFLSVVAPPKLFGRTVVVSNAESMTVALSLDSRAPLWSYPIGSVAQAKVYKDNILLGGSNGTLVSLNARTGQVSWSKNILENGGPIISLYVSPKFDVLYVASGNGQVFLVNPNDGKILDSNFPIGEINGDFFAGYGKADACISSAAHGFRCYSASSVPLVQPRS